MKLFSLSIFQKILVAMLLVALVPLSIIWYINNRGSTEQLEASIDQRLGDVSDKLVSNVNDWILLYQKVLNQNAALADMITLERPRQDPILRSVLKAYESSYLVFAVGIDGMNTGRSDDRPLINYGDRAYFKQVIEGQPMGSQVVISRTNNKPALIMSAPIYSPEINVTNPGEKNVLGVLAIGISVAEISERITNIRIGSTGFAFLLDENGKVVAHPGYADAKELVDLSKHPAFVNRPATGKIRIEYTDDGRPVIAFVQRAERGWTMVAQQDIDEAYAPIHQANRRAALILGITLVIVTLIAYAISQRLANPIRNLTRIADEMSRGRTVVSIAETKRGDEIGALAGAIDRMGTSIRLAIERLSAKP